MVAGWNANRQRSNLFHIRKAFKKQLQQINGKQTFGNQIRTTFHRDPAAPSSTYTPRERRLRPWQSLVVVDDHLYSQSSKSKSQPFSEQLKNVESNNWIWIGNRCTKLFGKWEVPHQWTPVVMTAYDLGKLETIFFSQRLFFAFTWSLLEPTNTYSPPKN